MLEIIGLLILGIIVGKLLKNNKIVRKFSDCVNLTVCLLVFVLGFTVGGNENEKVVGEFGKVIGTSLILGLAGIIGSIFGAYWIGKVINRGK